jgi:ADP-heptose:LPS heptosyltransferase
VAEERILLIQLRQLGDILLTTPCVAAVRQERPRAKIAFLSHAMGRLVLDDNPHVDEHFFYESGWSLAQHARFVANLRERNFDLVVDFMNNPRSALFTMATGAPDRVAFRSSRRFAYTTVVPKSDEPRYVVERKLKLLEAAGFKPNGIPELGKPAPGPRALNLTLPWFESSTRPFMQLLGRVPTVRDAPLRVVLSPTHRRERRRWPLDRYAELADWLVRDWGAAVIWLWGPGEEATIDAVQQLCKEATIKAPPTTLRELAALVANCDFFVGNSNGPSHIAVATGIPSLQLHGHTDGAAWTPPGQGRHRYLQAPLTPGDEEPRIESLDLAVVKAAVEGMRGVIEAHAAWMKQRGPRFQWRSH